ncbi:MAG: 3-hydroxyacyl-CoA dehydrogenase NAD-binding domain-containing protein, partial [Ilumatobacteraceae bacterium]
MQPAHPVGSRGSHGELDDGERGGGRSDELLDPSAIIATNTSTLPVVELAVATTRTDRECGLHFFNPATAMPLVEIVTPLTVA